MRQAVRHFERHRQVIAIGWRELIAKIDALDRQFSNLQKIRRNIAAI